MMNNPKGPLWGYGQKEKGFRYFSNEQEWEGQLDVHGAISYLKDDLQRSLKDDFYIAYEAYEGGKKGGFFALLRIVFPYITFLGMLLSGKKSSKNAIEYMNKYLSKVNTDFEDKILCGFIYEVYRNALAHTNMPKVVSENGKVFGWRIVFDDSQHLNVDKQPGISGKIALLSISPKKLADEVISSIDEYIKDLQNGSASFDTFKKGFLFMVRASQNIKIPSCLEPDQSR